MSHRRAADSEPSDAVKVAKIEGPLGIIAGRGSLPAFIADAASADNVPVHIVAIRGEADRDIERFPHTWIKWGEVGKVFTALDKNGCNDLVIIGGVSRPDFKNVRIDLGALKALPFLLSLSKGGDDHILSRIVRFFEQKGYRVHGAGDVLPELLVPEGTLTRRSPSAGDEADMALAFEVVRTLGKLDIGQAAVVSNGYVLAVEAAEGTDAMLERCAAIKQEGRSHGTGTGVLVKAPKPGQEERVDMPTIGPETMLKAAEAGLSGVAVAAQHVLIADYNRTIQIANERKLFLYGAPWGETEA
ncbi:LpxI family protein [Methyloceanibacter caenitepidi]|uniref:LpxI family protein n=1 Tax=Methyloceanibacter caenitepidi TaxID=1384459 RepID=UPI0005F05D00|nr:UDP-2,3-diacylglucosamine diphosphatase LpxI [Methyloceanibacter caenitepidi]